MGKWELSASEATSKGLTYHGGFKTNDFGWNCHQTQRKEGLGSSAVLNSQPRNGRIFHPYPQIMAVDYRFLPDLLLLSGWILGSHVEHFLLDVGKSPAQVAK